MLCANCDNTGVFTTMTAIGEKAFCCEACYAEYVGLPIKEEGYYGLASETFEAEFLYYYVLNEKGESPADFDTLVEAQAYVANSSEPLEIYERRSRNDEAYKMDKKMNAETFGAENTFRNLGIGAVAVSALAYLFSRRK